MNGNFAGVSQRRWLKKDAVAEYLGVSPRTIDNWRRDLGFPSTRISRVVRFDQAEVDAWVADQA